MKRISLAQGNGGRLMQSLLDEIVFPHIANEYLNTLTDAARVPTSKRTAITTDSFIVTPLRFPGGDIGKLAACGTINDLSVSGARPEYITLSIIVEEGFPVEELENYILSFAKTCRENRVKVVCGDTKVMPSISNERPALILNTTGIGEVLRDDLSLTSIRDGDKLLISGPIGEHAIAVLLAREDFGLSGSLVSDCDSIGSLAKTLLQLDGLRFMRDPTRGGLLTVCHEILLGTKIGVSLHESYIPVRETVKGACDLLGYDPLVLACEGRLLAVIAPEQSQQALERLKALPQGSDAAIIGSMSKNSDQVLLHTAWGGERILMPLEGDPLPRIC